MQVQKISNYQTGRNNTNPAFGLKIATGRNLQTAIDTSPAKEAINKGIAAIEKQFASNPKTYTFEMFPEGGLSIKSDELDTYSGITDTTLKSPAELLGVMRTIARG